MTRAANAFAALAALFATAQAVAGELEPPAAPAPTPPIDPRTPIGLETTPGDDDSFFIISQPGSYRLTDNFFVGGLLLGRHGIVIESSDVTLDLSGFTLDGFTFISFPFQRLGVPDPVTGVLASGPVENITVRSGIVRDWSGSGVDLSAARGAVVEAITAAANLEDGIRVDQSSIVRDCVARANMGTGIRAESFGVTVQRCVAHANGNRGIVASGIGGLVIDCTSTENEGIGILVAGGSTVTRCTSGRNGGPGIESLGQSLIVTNTCLQNGQGTFVAAGIRARDGDHVESNVVRGNDVGIEASDSDCVIVCNSAVGNTVNYQITGDHAVGAQIGSQDPITANAWANFDF